MKQPSATANHPLLDRAKSVIVSPAPRYLVPCLHDNMLP